MQRIGQALTPLWASAGMGVVTGLFVGLALGGCDAVPPDPPHPASISLGTAQLDGTGYAPLAGDVTLVEGAQGGFHVWLKFRVSGMTPATVTATHTARRKSDGALVSRGVRTIDVGAAGEGGYWETPLAAPTFLCPTPIGISVRDQTLVFHVELSDESGTVLGVGDSEATPHCPTGSQAEFCSSICSG
jgi:hypothetical protein